MCGWGGGGVSPVIVGGNGVGDPCGISIGVDDANGGDVVERALVQQDVVFQRVQADDEVGPQRGAVEQLLLEARDVGVVLVDDFDLAAAQDLLAVGDAAGDPALKQVVALGQLGGARHGAVLAVAGADKQHNAASSRHLVDDFGGAAEVGGGGFERDDVDALADAVDVAGVGGVPQRGDVPLVGFGGEEELEGDVGGRGGVGEEGVRLVVRADVGAQGAQLLLLPLVRLVLLRDTAGRRRRGLGRRTGVVEADAGQVLSLPLLLEAPRCLVCGVGGVGGVARALEGAACEGGGCSNN